MIFPTVRRLHLSRRSGLVRCAALLAIAGSLLIPQHSSAQQNNVPTVHVPYFAAGANPGQGAIFWLGKVEQGTNYADVRIAYDDQALVFILHVFDRRVSYDDKAIGSSDLTQFDSLSLYLDTQNDLTAPLAGGSRRFDAAVSWWELRDNYQRAYTWDGSSWQAATAAFETEPGFRAGLNDDTDDRGWTMRYRVPFASMGLGSAPAQGSVMRLALTLHDRDELDQPVLPDQTWPAGATVSQPATWGHVAFGVPAYTAPAVVDPQLLTLRHGVDGVVVTDAAVGGHSECGYKYDPNYFDGWGEANYAGYAQFNVQNQWDVADWPCFSKFYLTFPLRSLPQGSGVVSATLTMYMFGNAGYGPGDAKPSYMQVARVAEDWTEQTVTWNNAPPVLENYTWSWIQPVDNANDHSGRPRTWDMSRAVADAYATGEPLRLVVYSTDGDYHSGKYFWAAEADKEVRPRLDIMWGAAGFSLSTTPVKQMIHSGETAEFDVNVKALRAGETVVVEAGASTPSGLQVAVAPQQVMAPGGKAIVTLKDTVATQEARVYRVPLTVRSGADTRSVELIVFVNGRLLFLPAIKN